MQYVSTVGLLFILFLVWGANVLHGQTPSVMKTMAAVADSIGGLSHHSISVKGMIHTRATDQGGNFEEAFSCQAYVNGSQSYLKVMGVEMVDDGVYSVTVDHEAKVVTIAKTPVKEKPQSATAALEKLGMPALKESDGVKLETLGNGDLLLVSRDPAADLIYETRTTISGKRMLPLHYEYLYKASKAGDIEKVVLDFSYMPLPSGTAEYYSVKRFVKITGENVELMPVIKGYTIMF